MSAGGGASPRADAGRARPGRYDPGSFRDRHARVGERDGRVVRWLDAEGLAAWRALAASPCFETLVADDRLIGTREVAPEPAPAPAPAGGWAGALEHDRVPFVSYPFEWSFLMLRDAALRQLEVLGALLADDLVLVDGSSYNVQWRGVAPVYVDVGSIARLLPGQPWLGYRQFCELHLFPLMLAAYRGVPFGPWLRGRLAGLDAPTTRRLLGARALGRRGVFTHVWLAAWLSRTRDDATQLSRELSAAGFRRELIEVNVRRLTALIRGLTAPARRSAWADYVPEREYAAEDLAGKRRFVEAAIAARPRALVWDVGCHRGEFARAAAAAGAQVVALDADEAIVDELYAALRREQTERILPLVVDLADLPAGLGWCGAERAGLGERGRPDLVLALAFLHHLVIANQVRLEEALDGLLDLAPELVLEFAPREDPRVQALLARVTDAFDDYDEARLDAWVGVRCEVLADVRLPRGGRRLLHLRRR